MRKRRKVREKRGREPTFVRRGESKQKKRVDQKNKKLEIIS
jgi:hypothetical protein